MSQQTFQLPSENNVEIITKQIDKIQSFLILKEHFEALGFEFIYERAQIFMTFQNHNAPSRPSLLLIIPSLVSVDLRTDPSHQAISLTAFINGEDYSFLATEVTVKHNPYSIDDYTLYSLGTNNVVQAIASITKEDLIWNDIDTIVDNLKEIEINVGRIMNASVPYGDFGYIIKRSLSKFLNDEYTQQYPDKYRFKMLEECPLIEKFSKAIAEKQKKAAHTITLCCSTSCNACCTTSSSVAFS
jgi:hypothetical protein